MGQSDYLGCVKSGWILDQFFEKVLPKSQVLVPHTQSGPSILKQSFEQRFTTDLYKEMGGLCPKSPKVAESFQQGPLKAKGEVGRG